MSVKHSPRKITLAMIKGKPIATSVPVIHYHASDDELEEIYPSTDEEKQLTPEHEKSSSKVNSQTPSKCAHESDISENNSESRSISTENILLEGTPPSLDPWKVLSEIKGKITKTFEEKLCEIKSDKKKRRHSKGETSSISDLEDQGCITPCDEKINDIHRRGNPTKYVGFSGIKTGLKDKSLQDESVESGIEASEFSQNVDENTVSSSRSDLSNIKTSNIDNYTTFPQQTQYACTVAFSKRVNFKTLFSQLIKQLICQATYKSVAVFIAISCIYYIIPLAEYLLGFVMGIFMTIIFYDIVTKFKKILTTLPDETYSSSLPIPVLEIPAVEEHAVIERYQGWLNELPCNYEPNNYHVARTKSVFFRLEGNILRIMETRMKIPKKAVWDEPKHKLKFVRRRVYNLTGAKIELLPYGLARRRRWSKKYPICIVLKKEALICNVILKNATDDECSMNSYHGKMNLKRKMKYKSDKKWDGEIQDADEILFVNMENEEPIIKQDVYDIEDVENTDEDDNDSKNYNYDLANDYIDNECVKYEEYFMERKEKEEYMEEKEKQKKERYSKEEQKRDDKEKKDVNKTYVCTNRKKKKRRETLNEMKICKRWKMKDDWEEEKQNRRKERQKDIRKEKKRGQ